MTGAVSFKTLVGNISGPLALDGFTDFVTPFVSMTILGISGMSLVSRVRVCVRFLGTVVQKHFTIGLERDKNFSEISLLLLSVPESRSFKLFSNKVFYDRSRR